ncbi:MAG: hypothetical protein NZ870_05045, partial [bacterium]|nr:hypothetical protein [bacterium]
MELKNIFIDCGGTLIKLKYPVGVIYSKIANDFDVNCDPKILESRFSKLWANREINIKTSEE